MSPPIHESSGFQALKGWASPASMKSGLCRGKTLGPVNAELHKVKETAQEAGKKKSLKTLVQKLHEKRNHASLKNPGPPRGQVRCKASTSGRLKSGDF